MRLAGPCVGMGTRLLTTSVAQASLAAGLYGLSAGRRSSSWPAVSLSCHPVSARHSHTLLVWSSVGRTALLCCWLRGEAHPRTRAQARRDTKSGLVIELARALSPAHSTTRSHPHGVLQHTRHARLAPLARRCEAPCDPLRLSEGVWGRPVSLAVGWLRWETIRRSPCGELPAARAQSCLRSLATRGC